MKHRINTQEVTGSNPVPPTIVNNRGLKQNLKTICKLAKKKYLTWLKECGASG
ncbi:hypothetical protein ACFLVC_00035 [Chloroflexota bacterium]